MISLQSGVEQSSVVIALGKLGVDRLLSRESERRVAVGSQQRPRRHSVPGPIHGLREVNGGDRDRAEVFVALGGRVVSGVEGSAAASVADLNLITGAASPREQRGSNLLVQITQSVALQVSDDITRQETVKQR